MKRAGIAAGLIMTVAVLAGCVAMTSANSTPTPTAPPAATENEVTSVLAKNEGDWRNVIDSAVGCRLDWVTSPGKMSNLSCYLREQTIVWTSQTTVKSWDEMVIPESMTGIVNDTSAILTGIGGVDLIGACGEGSEPSSSDQCSTALSTLYGFYVRLGSQLDAWRPYL